MKYIFLVFILIITIALYLWPDFHPEKLIVKEHHWYIDLIMHGGYFFTAMFALLNLRIKQTVFLQGLTFFLISVALELLQYFSYNRSVDIVDVGCNFVGIIGALGLYLFIERFKIKNELSK